MRLLGRSYVGGQGYPPVVRYYFRGIRELLPPGDPVWTVMAIVEQAVRRGC